MHVAAASNPTVCAEILGIQKDPHGHQPQIPGIADDQSIWLFTSHSHTLLKLMQVLIPANPRENFCRTSAYC